MKLVRNIVIGWLVVVTLLIWLFISKSKPTTETRAFCAYGRVFVEFEENGKVWGSLMLDYYGHPIPCREGVEPTIENTV